MAKNNHKYFIRGAFLIFLYLLISFAPLLVVMVGLAPTERNFWKEFSIALGFVGLTMMCLQFALTARIQTLAAPFGMDMVLQFHKYISLVVFGVILLHPILLFWIDEQVEDQEYLALLNVFEAPFRAQMAIASVVFLFLIIIISVYRKQLGLRYELWKAIHWILAVLIITTAVLHVFGVNNYLDADWKKAFWVVIIAGTFFLLVYIRLIKPSQLINKKYRVKKVTEHEGEAWSLVFEPVGHEGMKFSPGQFAWLTLGNTPYQMEEHPFSFTSSAENLQEIEVTIKALGDYTSKIGEVKPGQIAHLEGPHGVFTPDRNPDAQGYVMLAGGVGITPMMSMLRTFADKKDKRPLILIYANNTRKDIIFFNEINEISNRLHLKVVHVLADPTEDWNGEVGFIDEKLLRKYLPDDKNNYVYFICGPLPMMTSSEDGLLALGVEFENIEREVFDLV